MITKALKDAINNPTWQEKAACLGYDPRIFLEKGGDNVRTAKMICGMCDVREICLEWALQNEKHGSPERVGIYGGLLPSARRKIKLCALYECMERCSKKDKFCSPEHEAEDKKRRNRNNKKRQQDKNGVIRRINKEFYMRGKVNTPNG